MRKAWLANLVRISGAFPDAAPPTPGRPPRSRAPWPPPPPSPGPAAVGQQGWGPPGQGVGALLPPVAWGSPQALLGGPGLQKAVAWVTAGGFPCLIFVPPCLKMLSRRPCFLSLVCRAFCMRMLSMSLQEGGLKHTSCSLTQAHLSHERSSLTA